MLPQGLTAAIMEVGDRVSVSKQCKSLEFSWQWKCRKHRLEPCNPAELVVSGKAKMFYHQTLLQRRGQLGIIWMEAVQASPYRICNRQVLQVNVIRTCSRILEGINARNENDGFSLYLSAHLMYGVVSIWRKQINILLAEAQEFKNRMRSDTAVLESIDLHHQPKLDQINIPDAVTRAGDEDPFFGSLKHFDETWDAFLRARIYPEIPSPVLPLSPDRHRETVSDSPTFLEPGKAGSQHRDCKN
ncbi:meiotic recombination protein REC8 homolog [Babylonia areolata]|uniref:meiotic recombination protein REC8 homolog n=1 Tax=Babylonia areolata TaxID=304850 RepID=UPI003FD03DFD